MSHTFKTTRGNNKLTGRAAHERALRNSQQKKKERTLREARKRSHD